MLLGRRRVARWAEEEEAGMDVGIACSQRWVSLERCETRRARVCALAHAAAVLTVRVVQIDSSRLCGRGERDSAGVKGRGVDAHLLAYSGRHARTHAHTHAHTHARTIHVPVYRRREDSPLPLPTHVANLSRAALYSCELQIRPCPMRRPERRRACAGSRA